MKDKLSDAVESYIRFRGSQDYSKSTIKVDKQVLNRFLDVSGNIWCHNIAERHIERHFDEVSKTNKPSSLAVHHTVLKQFLAWGRHTGRMPSDRDPMYGRRSPRGMQRERERIPVHEFPRLLDAAGQRCDRDRALVATLLYTLMRESEVTSLRIGNIDLQGGWITATIHKSRLEDRMPISEELDGELRRWLTSYTKAVGELQPHFLLIPARASAPILGEGNRIVAHDVVYRPEAKIRSTARIIRPTLEAVGISLAAGDGSSNYEGAHTLRRSGARALYDGLAQNGYDHAVRVVQAMLHHKSMTMTERYLGITADRRSRDDIIRGKRMYGNLGENVIRMAK